MQVLSSVLLWNFALTNQLNKLPSKIQKDFVPTLINGKPSASTPLLVCVLRAQIASAPKTPLIISVTIGLKGHSLQGGSSGCRHQWSISMWCLCNTECCGCPLVDCSGLATYHTLPTHRPRVFHCWQFCTELQSSLLLDSPKKPALPALFLVAG